MDYENSRRAAGSHNDDWDQVHQDWLTVQKKSLDLSEPEDDHEKEADDVARKVVNGKSASIKESSGSISRKGAGESGAAQTPEFQSKLESSKGGGQALDDNTRGEMESKMSSDFGDVKIHTGKEAQQLSANINAKAFAHGQDIYFGQNQYDPESKDGKELLAHELVHTQQGGVSGLPRKLFRSRLRDYVAVNQADLHLSNADIEATNEYKSYMNPSLVWQTDLHVTADEARLACLMILSDLRAGTHVDWQSKAREYVLNARKRLTDRGPGIDGPARLGSEISVVDETRANELFSQMAGLTFFNDQGVETPIPFHYPIDGCYARAHLMSERLTTMGYASKKQFAVSWKPGRLTVTSPYSKDAAAGTTPTTNWWYHVAPIIEVKKADGTIVEMVIDPSVTDHPITVDEWTGLMRSDGFEHMTLDQIRTEYSNNADNYPNNRSITYSTDRSAYIPGDFNETEDKAYEHAQMNSDRPLISDYARMATAHDAVAFIRSELQKPVGQPIDVAGIISRLQALNGTDIVQYHDAASNSGTVRHYIAAKYPQLLAQLAGRITGPEMTQINTIVQ